MLWNNLRRCSTPPPILVPRVSTDFTVMGLFSSKMETNLKNLSFQWTQGLILLWHAHSISSIQCKNHFINSACLLHAYSWVKYQPYSYHHLFLVSEKKFWVVLSIAIRITFLKFHISANISLRDTRGPPLTQLFGPPEKNCVRGKTYLHEEFVSTVC